MQSAIGAVQAHSLWRFLQSELAVNQDVVVTLRAESLFGVLPSLEMGAIADASRKAVTEAYERVMNVVYRDSATSVVDQCRNLAAVLGGRWMFQITGNEKKLEDDLGGCISAIRDHFGEKNQRLVRAALETINLLHPRGKDNERVRYALREVSNEDAELALHAVGFVLRDQLPILQPDQAAHEPCRLSMLNLPRNALRRWGTVLRFGCCRGPK